MSDVNLGILQYQSIAGTNAAGEPVNTYSLSLCLCIGYAKYQTNTIASPSEDISRPAQGETVGSTQSGPTGSNQNGEIVSSNQK